jgi:hypothetical protein
MSLFSFPTLPHLITFCVLQQKLKITFIPQLAFPHCNIFALNSVIVAEITEYNAKTGVESLPLKKSRKIFYTTGNQ